MYVHLCQGVPQVDIHYCCLHESSLQRTPGSNLCNGKVGDYIKVYCPSYKAYQWRRVGSHSCVYVNSKVVALTHMLQLTDWTKK